MPISCAVLADIALSHPVKTLTLPAIETPRERTQLSEISEYCHPGRLGPDCHHVDARTVRPAFASSRLLAAGMGEFKMTKAFADVLTTTVADGIAVITLGSARRIYFDEEMGDALTEALDGCAGDANVRVVVITGGAPGYFIRHYSIAALIRLAESLRTSGREWPENATYNSGFLDKAIALCESMPKPVIAAISG